MMLKRSRESRALTRVTEEARRQSISVSTEGDLEERVLEAVHRPPRSPNHPPRPARMSWLFVPVAALAVAAAVSFWPKAPELVPEVFVQPMPDRVDGEALGPEVLVSATSESIEVAHGHRVLWVLEPGSRARVLEHGDRVRVQLLGGSLRARVVPGVEPERFVVEARETRVAVHGTIFSVKLEGDQTIVHVEQGVVAVAPRNDTSAPVFLKAPTSGRFSAGGRSEAQASKRSARERASIARRQPAEAQPPAAPLASAAPRELTIGEVEAGVTTVVHAITRCFEEHTTRTGGVTIHARTAVTLDVAADGSVRDVRFAPPLSPPVQACGETDARAARFASAGQDTTITRVLELSR
jgi:hypothetical protein